jgi:hypothetical protein
VAGFRQIIETGTGVLLLSTPQVDASPSIMSVTKPIIGKIMRYEDNQMINVWRFSAGFFVGAALMAALIVAYT